MAKGQKRSSREIRKPKADKTKAPEAAATLGKLPPILSGAKKDKR